MKNNNNKKNKTKLRRIALLQCDLIKEIKLQQLILLLIFLSSSIFAIRTYFKYLTVWLKLYLRCFSSVMTFGYGDFG